MHTGRIAKADAVLGRSQGYQGLAVRVEAATNPANGVPTPCMTSAWYPTPDEIERIRNGAPIYLQVFGDGHPPVNMSVGPEPL